MIGFGSIQVLPQKIILAEILLESGGTISIQNGSLGLNHGERNPIRYIAAFAMTTSQPMRSWITCVTMCIGTVKIVGGRVKDLKANYRIHRSGTPMRL